MRKLSLVLVLLAFAAAAGAQQTAAIVPVAGSVAGAGGSSFTTTLQLNNPSPARAAGKLVLVAGSDLGSLDYALAPGETKDFGDVIGAMGLSGIGSLDIRPASGALPIAHARISGKSTAGPAYGFDLTDIDINDAATAGTTLVLVAPADLTQFRWNIGVRALERGAALAGTLRSRSGTEVRTLQKTYAPNAFAQVSAADFAEGAVQAGDSLELMVQSGAAIVYAATTDNTTQDPTVGMAQRARRYIGSLGTVVEVKQTDNPAVQSTPWRGAGWISGLGNVRISADQTVDFSVVPPLMKTTARFVDANGDELTMTGIGAAMPPDAQNILNFQGLFTMTGGTGRFAGATGTLQYNGGADLEKFTGFFSVDGTLNLRQ